MKNKEVEKLLVAVTKMEENKIKVDNAYLAELQKNFKLIQRIWNYEDQSIIIQMLAEEKHSIWHNINANVTDLWPFIQIIFEQEVLVQTVKVAIEKTKSYIEHKLEEAQTIIRMLNSKTKE